METTNKKNAELKEMYQTFYNEMYQAFNIKKKVKFEMKKYNGIQLLTCFDSYLNADNKIMIYGQEANTDEGRVFDFSPQYQKDGYYKYEYKIAHVGEKGIPKSECRQTEYLKTRELIAGFDKSLNPEKREAENETITNFIYKSCNDFRDDGYAVVKKENDKLCVINKNGEQIGGEYDSIDNYSNEDKSET